MTRRLFYPIIDNGMGLSRTQWSECAILTAMSGVFSGIEVTTQRFSSPYPREVMNSVADAFMKSRCGEMLLQDLDVIYTPRDMALLLSHRLPYVGGILPKRVLGLELAMWTDQPLAENPEAEGVDPLVPAFFGRGFCLIERMVFEALAAHSEEYMDIPTGQSRRKYFEYKRGGIGSEDFYLCERWKSIGGNPVIDQRIILKHQGDATYPIPGTF